MMRQGDHICWVFRTWAFGVAWIALLVGVPVDAAQWASGADLKKRLLRPVGPIRWSANSLGDALESLSNAHRVAILLDRRVDPGQKVELGLDDVTLREALVQIARHRQLGFTMFGPVAYFGPPEVTSRLRTVAALRTEGTGQLPAGARRRLLLRKTVAWDDFAEPRRLIEELCRGGRLGIAELQRVPHDLWAGADLPPLTLVDRLSLILFQFDLTFEVSADGKTVTLLGVPDDVALVRSYPGGGDPKSTAEKYASLAPNARVKVVGKKVYVKGSAEDHQRISSPRRADERVGVQGAGRDFSRLRFDVTIEEKPVGKLLEGLAGQLKLELRIDHQALQAAGVSLQTRVSLNAHKATVDELFRQLTRPARLKFRREGHVIEITAAE